MIECEAHGLSESCAKCVNELTLEKMKHMSEVLSHIGKIAGVKDGDVRGLIDWAESTKSLHPTQDPKYGIKDNQLVNMATEKPIPNDEPIMLFRAKDNNAEETVGYYSGLCKNKDHQRAVSLRHYQFINFKDLYPERMSEPDTQIS